MFMFVEELLGLHKASAGVLTHFRRYLTLLET